MNNIARWASLLLTAALASALLAGCGKETTIPDDEDEPWKELLGDKPIHFSTRVAEPVTKATSPLANGKDFAVFGFLQEGTPANPGAWGSGVASSSWNTAFMHNIKVSKENDTYSYSPLHYWPYNEENTVSFWAYSPHNPSVTLYESGTATTYTRSSTGLPDIRFDATDGTADFMTADLVKDKTYASCSPTPGTVDFTFHHHLSWIEFKAQAAADYSPVNLSLTLTSIQIIKDYSRAVYRQSVSDWRDRSVERNNANAATAFSGSLLLEYNNPKPCSSAPLLLIPQDMAHDGAGESGNKVTAIITYNQKIGNYNTTKTAEVSLDNVPGIDSWEKNSRYVYTLTISSGDAISLKVEVQPWEYWLGTSDYTENVTITKSLEWESGTFETGSAGVGANYTEEASFTIDDGSGYTGNYKVLVLKPGTNLRGSFIFDTPYQGTWYAMLEPIMGSQDASIVFSDGSIVKEGLVGNESTIEIKAAGVATTAQYAILRFMCRTALVDPSDPTSAQTLYVNPALLGGQFIIKQNIN